MDEVGRTNCFSKYFKFGVCQRLQEGDTNSNINNKKIKDLEQYFTSFCRRFGYFVCLLCFFFWTWLQVPAVLSRRSSQEFIVAFCWIVHKLYGHHVSVSLSPCSFSHHEFYVRLLCSASDCIWITLLSITRITQELNEPLEEWNFCYLLQKGKGRYCL